MAEYSRHGYDMTRQTRYVYAFLSAGGRRVKIGMVGNEARLGPRLVQVTKRSNEPGLTWVAFVAVENVNEHEMEDIEAAVRTWLSLAAGFEHAGLVDWLFVPEVPPADWQDLLGRATGAVLAWGS